MENQMNPVNKGDVSILHFYLTQEELTGHLKNFKDGWTYSELIRHSDFVDLRDAAIKAAKEKDIVIIWPSQIYKALKAKSFEQLIEIMQKAGISPASVLSYQDYMNRTDPQTLFSIATKVVTEVTANGTWTELVAAVL